MKKIISFVVIVIALGAAIVLGYLALSKNSPAGADPAPATTSAVLPEGTKLDFNAVQSYNKDGRLFPYPKVSPEEIGASSNSLVK